MIVPNVRRLACANELHVDVRNHNDKEPPAVGLSIVLVRFFRSRVFHHVFIGGGWPNALRCFPPCISRRRMAEWYAKTVFIGGAQPIGSCPNGMRRLCIHRRRTAEWSVPHWFVPHGYLLFFSHHITANIRLTIYLISLLRGGSFTGQTRKGMMIHINAAPKTKSARVARHYFIS